jgi:hypothetical protein
MAETRMFLVSFVPVRFATCLVVALLLGSGKIDSLLSGGSEAAQCVGSYL